jgi:hypothetical protein
MERGIIPAADLYLTLPCVPEVEVQYKSLGRSVAFAPRAVLHVSLYEVQ